MGGAHDGVFTAVEAWACAAARRPEFNLFLIAHDGFPAGRASGSIALSKRNPASGRAG